QSCSRPLVACSSSVLAPQTSQEPDLTLLGMSGSEYPGRARQSRTVPEQKGVGGVWKTLSYARRTARIQGYSDSVRFQLATTHGCALGGAQGVPNASRRGHIVPPDGKVVKCSSNFPLPVTDPKRCL